jgi:uncharacterized protein (TIGR04255 family)
LKKLLYLTDDDKAMRYKNAPIKEAIFDLRVGSLANCSLEQLELIHDVLKDGYPNKRKSINISGKLEIKDSKHIFQDTGSNILGYIFSNLDNNRVVQYRLDGFTYNMISPYTEWSDFSNEAFKLYDIYQSNFIPSSIARIALRYINRIELPVTFKDFNEFILNMPPIPKCLPQTFNHFFMQINVPCDKPDTSVILTETIEPISKEKLPFILDIDVFKIGQIELSIEKLKREFEELRIIKNSIFENTITDKLRKIFTDGN